MTFLDFNVSTADFEVEQDEMSRANPPVHLTRELWVCSPPHLLGSELILMVLCSARS